jgi:hypothetical protein
MDSVRIKFQRALSVVEERLREYKNSYPRNFGALIRTSFPASMVWLSILFFFDGFAGGSGGEEWIGEFLISVVLFVFSGLMWGNTRYLRNTKPPESAVEALEKDFGEYPDVQKYIQKCKTDLDTAVKRKTRNKRIFNIGFYGIMSVMTVLYFGNFLVTFITEINADENVCNTNGHDGMRKLLELDRHTPLLRLKPLETNNGENIKTATETFDVYLQDFYKNESGGMRMLAAVSPVIQGAESGGMYRVTITEADGRAVKRCPRFSFSADECGGRISSYAFCYDNKSGKQNKFMTVQTLLYLQENQDKLRFSVEKL